MINGWVREELLLRFERKSENKEKEGHFMHGPHRNSPKYRGLKINFNPTNSQFQLIL